MLFKKNTMINNSYDYSSNAINGYSWYMYSSNYCYNGLKTNKQKHDGFWSVQPFAQLHSLHVLLRNHLAEA